MAALAFLDESGDESGKLQQGASRLFVVGLVVFADSEEAARCRERIDRLRTELRKPARFEFHFRDNGHADRLAFLKAVAPFAFTYHAVTLEKRTIRAEAHMSLYVDAVARVCALVGEECAGLRLIVDARGSGKHNRRSEGTAIRQRVNTEGGRPLLTGVRAQDSAQNNLLQLADYVTGIVSRAEQKKSGSDEYRWLLNAHEGNCLREIR